MIESIVFIENISNGYTVPGRKQCIYYDSNLPSHPNIENFRETETQTVWQTCRCNKIGPSCGTAMVLNKSIAVTI